ncbi:FecCD family ABC transporter permease [Pseudonocardia sp. TMWB2A]|uniref:FecCD family ABC transporter permease n=1 Tax=Pseudonocardia sp. TMWB2A TaxID=687430 RepID=UPI00307EAA0D
MKRPTSRIMTFLLGAALVALVLASLAIGQLPFGLSEILRGVSGQADTSTTLILFDIRLPRSMAALSIGIVLGASGAALQGLLRNPLAEPGILGISASAAFGATTALYFGYGALSPVIVPLAAISTALLATGLMSIAAIRARGVASLILVGVGLSSLAGALMSLLLNFAPNPFSLADMVRWMLGSVANRSINDLLYTLPLMLIGLIFLLVERRSLSALSLGEESAHGLGVNLKRTRLFIILGAGIASGASVALGGAIGFVGMVAPHLVRPLTGYDPGRAVIPSALLGGMMVLAADMIVRVLPTPVELQLGVIIAIIGAPLFIWIAVKQGNIRHG